MSFLLRHPVLSSALALLVLWWLFVFCMAIMRARDEGSMTLLTWAMASPLLAVGVPLDWLLNYSLLALLTWDWPREGERLFSQRLSRLTRELGFRGWYCRLVAKVLLNPFDRTGVHVK